MKQYYFVGTLLPPLSFEAPPEITFEQLRLLLKDNLSEPDYEKTYLLRRFYDLLNLRALFQEEPFDPRGELSPLEMEDALINRVGLPDYIYDFVDTYTTQSERIKHFPLLLARFFQSTKEFPSSFLRRYFAFERELRLVMTAFRAKKLGYDLKEELQYEDPEEPLIAQLLAFKESEPEEMPPLFATLQPIFDKYKEDPLALQKAIDRFRFDTIEEMIDPADVFSLQRILAYFAQFLIVDSWSTILAKGQSL